MIFPFIIIIRILFVACMVFIIGYVFGGFSKKRGLTVITKVAAILAIVLFISANVILMRFAWHHNDGKDNWRHCGPVQTEKQQ
ncbi:hypothetical protein [Chitinophaga sp. MM2321]|uniref:hypothetical protein n=1 Tax=Chitinophaga sp. MM2321 TaxID=3137178 RepID=UPI0032D575FA